MNINLHLNLDQEMLLSKLESLNVTDSIKQKITVANSRVEFKENEQHLFMIFYIPEYNKSTKSIDTVEVNIIFDLEEKTVNLFANNSSYFF